MSSVGFGIDDAARLAEVAHAGQVDKQGRDYFEAHLVPIATVLEQFGEQAAMAGYLHDILEDTDYTAELLRAAGVPLEVVDAVVAVTRVPGEAYSDLIERAAAHPLGRLVKLADNTVNVAANPGLAETDPQRARVMLEERYLPARARLLRDDPEAEQLLERMVSAVEAGGGS